MNKLLIIAKREYLQVIRKPSFWITTLAFPAFIIFLSVISTLSAQSAETKLAELAAEAKGIYVFDQSGILDKALLQPPLQQIEDIEAGKQAVKEGKVDALIVYPQDFATSLKIDISVNSKGVFNDGAYDPIAKNLVKQSILNKLGDANLTKVFNADYATEVTSYKNGEQIENGFEAFIVPLISVGIYFILVTFATSLLLQSVSEEKENRMIETILSIVTPRELIWGKIAGQLSIVITQVVVLAIFALGGLVLLSRTSPIDLSSVEVTFAQLFWAVFFTVCGFLLNANIMVGVGAAMPTYREAGGLSSVFIFAALIPVYLATSLIAEPSGTLAIFFSYFPFTSPLILLFRNALGELSGAEQLLGAVASIAYVAVSFILAFKLFEFGALEYHNRISLRNFIQNLSRKK